MVSKWFKLLVVLLVLAILAGATLAAMWWQSVHQPIAVTESSLVYEVKSGANIRSVSKDLEQQGVIPNRWLLESWARYSGQAGALKAGEYALSPDLTMVTLLNRLVSGQSLQYRVTFPEGITVSEMLGVMRDNGRLKITLETKDIHSAVKSITGRDQSEGWFYPDTYQFSKGASDVDVLKMAYDKMRVELEQVWEKRDEGLPLQNAYEALILASIIEKETGVPDERPMIGGVFTQRLKKGMRLQTDPTVIYGMGDRYKGNIRKSDLKRDTPYNTYTREGLPPTPIASPGRGALMAAVNPEKTKALFFVAKGGGRHHFSETYKEHKQAVVKYLLGGNGTRYQGDK